MKGAAPARKFSIVRGGPFHALLSRLHLVGPDKLPTRKAALLLALLAWLPCALLVIATYVAEKDPVALTFFADYTYYTKSLLAVSLMIMAERSAELRLTPIVDQFRDTGLIAERDREKFEDRVERADELSSSSLAEGAILVFVLLLFAFGTRLDLEGSSFPWVGSVIDGEPVYTLAGHWSHLVAKPLFMFLLLRWLWRFAVWGKLLRELSKLSLELTVSHPDRSGGLGFLCVFPMVFSGLIFALSVTVAAELVADTLHEDFSYNVVRGLMVAWIALVVIVFVGPLISFLRPLYQLRERAIFDLGRLASEHQLAFERKWLAKNISGHELLGSEEVSSAADLGPVAQSPYALKVIPITMATALHLVVAAGVPMLVVVATQMPLEEFFGFLVQLVL